MLQEECQAVLQAKQELVDAVKSGLVANTEQLYKVVFYTVSLLASRPTPTQQYVICFPATFS